MRRVLLGIAVSLCCGLALASPGDESHAVASELRQRFPSVVLRSAATFERGEAAGGDVARPGLRARFEAGPELSVLYPQSYGDPVIVERAGQRVVLRAAGAAPSVAVQSEGTLIYPAPYRSTDAVEVPGLDRSEELLLLRDAGAPRVFDYELAETEGVEAVVIQDGAVRFLPKSGPSLQIDPVWIIDASGRRTESCARWSLLGAESIPHTIRLTLTLDDLVFPVLVDPSFSVTGSLGTARANHTMTLLPNGKVLVAGGTNGSHLALAELYDPATGQFTATGPLSKARTQHSATLLPNGKVLIAGGYSALDGFIREAELYDPATGVFMGTGALGSGRINHTATLLSDGKVLFAGGYNGSPMASAELYDPSDGTFSPTTGGLANARSNHTATLLQNGSVLIAGGAGASYVQAGEIYSPGPKSFALAGNIGTTRVNHTATLLLNGNVLIAGGYNPGTYLTSAELFTPGAGFSAISSMGTGRRSHSATLLPNGFVLIAGGTTTGGSPTTSAELYDGSSFTATTSLTPRRESHAATLLPSGKVLIAGGRDGDAFLSSVEVYEIASGALSAAGSLAAARSQHTATLLPDGRVLVAGGYNGSPLASAELYERSTNAFTATGNLLEAREQHTATLLSTGKVLIAGGVGTNGSLASAELYHPDNGSFSAAGSMTTARDGHTATLLANGTVLLAGGNTAGASAEIYDPVAGTFTATGSMISSRKRHTATLMPNGKVLLAGGDATGDTGQGTAELYDAAAGTFTQTASLYPGLTEHTATLLPNGRVLIAGGLNLESHSGLIMYDPGTGAFTPFGGLSMAHFAHTATLLPNGDVFVASGAYRLLVCGFPICMYSNYVQPVTERTDPPHARIVEALSLATGRCDHTATLLRTGEVLIVGGANLPRTAIGGGPSLHHATAELYSVAGFDPSRRPSITGAPASLVLPDMLSVTGSSFRGDSEGSSGATASSATDVPLVRLQRIDNEQVSFVRPSSPSTDVSWAGSLSGLAKGWYRVAVIANGVRSIEKLVEIGPVIPSIASVTPNRGRVTGGSTAVIGGSDLEGAGVTIGGNAATVVSTSATSASFVTPPHAAAVVNVTATTPSGGFAVAFRAYTYAPIPPASVVAQATGPTSVEVTWRAVADTTHYDVLRSTNGSTWQSLVNVGTTTFTDLSAQPDTAYLYKVRAATPILSDDSSADLATTFAFTDPTLTPRSTRIKAAHITELRTAVNAVRQLAALPAVTFPETLTAGSTLIRASHVLELRSALDAAREALLLPPMFYARPLTAGVTTIYADEVSTLRNGVR